MADARGEDRSSYQPIEGWGANTFAVMKASEGTSYRDPTFASNWANAKAEGKPRAAYHFLHPALSASAQASYFVATVNAHGGFQHGDAFMVDAEILSGDDGMEVLVNSNVRRRMHVPLQQAKPKRTASTVGSVALSFMNAVSGAVPGCKGAVYTDASMLEDLPGCEKYALFIAFYAASPPKNVAPWGNWTFWQKRAGGGYGGGDLDYYNGSNPADWFGGSTPTPSTNWTETLVDAWPMLQNGSTGLAVRFLQGALQAHGYDIAMDGDFGSTTQSTVKRFQGSCGLPEDGVVGQNTWTAVGSI